MSENGVDLSEVQANYDARISATVDKALDILRATPDLCFTFRTQAGSLDTSGHNTPATNLLKEISNIGGGHSQSSMNAAFGQLSQAVLNEGRSVKTTRVGDFDFVTFEQPATPLLWMRESAGIGLLRS